jgi:hypothetical protein
MPKIRTSIVESSQYLNIFLFMFRLNSAVFSDLCNAVKISQHTGLDLYGTYVYSIVSVKCRTVGASNLKECMLLAKVMYLKMR